MHPGKERLWLLVAALGLLVLVGCSMPSDASDATVPSAVPTTIGPSPTPPGSPDDGALTPSGPIRVTESGTVIENMHFTGSGDESCVTVKDAADVTIRNSRFTNCFKGVYAVSSSNVVVTDNLFEANMVDRGRNAVQFNRVSGGYIAHNTSTRTGGGTLSEDHINIFKSNGTSSHPIVIEGNMLVGGGPSESGSGIVLGDGGGSWQIARNNTLQDPGQVGMGAVGGSNMSIIGNTIFSSAHPWSNVGIVAWDWDGSGCSDITITDNSVPYWINAKGHSNVFWNGGNCTNVNVSGNSWQRAAQASPGDMLHEPR